MLLSLYYRNASDHGYSHRNRQPDVSESGHPVARLIESRFDCETELSEPIYRYSYHRVTSRRGTRTTERELGPARKKSRPNGRGSSRLGAGDGRLSTTAA